MAGPDDHNWTSFKWRNQVGSYRTTFQVPDAWDGRRVFLQFDGVDSAFYLWINGTKVGYSQGSRTPAVFDITNTLRPGENLLAAEVYQYSDGSYLEDQDFWRLSGIFRDVFLWSTSDLRIRDTFVHAGLDDQFKEGRLGVEVEVVNRDDAEAPVRVDLELIDETGATVWKREEGPVAIAPDGNTNIAIEPQEVPVVAPWTRRDAKPVYAVRHPARRRRPDDRGEPPQRRLPDGRDQEWPVARQRPAGLDEGRGSSRA